MTKGLKHYLSFFRVLLATIFLAGLATDVIAQETDRTRFLLNFNTKLDSDTKFTVQYYETETVKFALRDMYSKPEYMNTKVIQDNNRRFDQSTGRVSGSGIKTFKALEKRLGNSHKCDYDTTLEVRYIDPVDLSCGVVKPLADQSIEYNTINSSVYLDSLGAGLAQQSWKISDDIVNADVALLVELEISNRLDVMKGGLRLRLSNALQHWDELHIIGLKITGVNLDPEAENKIVFKSYLIKPLIEYPSEATLSSLMTEIGARIAKQKDFGTKRSHFLRFDNFEKVDK